MGGYESIFNAWCSPTTAANNLGHLVDSGLLTTPVFNDGFVAGIEIPISTAVSTIAWDTNHGWGDYLLDGPALRNANLVNRTVKDFGWYMNTNNLGTTLGQVTSTNPNGTAIINIYNGLY